MAFTPKGAVLERNTAGMRAVSLSCCRSRGLQRCWWSQTLGGVPLHTGVSAWPKSVPCWTTCPWCVMEKLKQHSRAGSSRAGLQPDLFARSALCCGMCGAGQTDTGHIVLDRTRLGPVTAAAPWGWAGCPLGAPTECAELRPHPSARFCSVPLSRWPELDKNTTVDLPGTTLLQGCYRAHTDTFPAAV